MKHLIPYQIYNTKSHGRVKYLRYKNETGDKRKVCKENETAKTHFFISDSEFIIEQKKTKSAAEHKRDYEKKMKDAGFHNLSCKLSAENHSKFKEIQRINKLKTITDVLNFIIQAYDIKPPEKED